MFLEIKQQNLDVLQPFLTIIFALLNLGLNFARELILVNQGKLCEYTKNSAFPRKVFFR